MTEQRMLRVFHPRWKDGVVVAERKSESGLPVANVVFDLDPTNERTILVAFLTESKKRMPSAAKETIKRKRTPKPTPEVIPDALLVADKEDPFLPNDYEVGVSAEE